MSGLGAAFTAGLADFSTLFEFLPIGAYRCAPDGQQLRANPALVRLNGFASEAEYLAEMTDIAGAWYVEPGRRAAFEARLAQEGAVVAFESEVFRYKTRERIWVSENAHVVRGPDGEVLYYEGTVEEITERVRDRDALLRGREELRQLVDLVPGMVYRVIEQAGGDYAPTFVSGGVLPLYGMTPEQVMGDPNILKRLRHPEDREIVEKSLREVQARGGLRHAEFRIRLHSGTVKWVQASSVPAPPMQGRRTRVGVITDISERKQAEALRLARDRAEAADAAKSQFLSRVSHELRTPLHAILGFSQLLQMQAQLTGQQQEWLALVLKSGQHLLDLMDDVLDLSSAQTGTLSVLREPVSLAPLLQDVAELLQGQAATAGVAMLPQPLGTAVQPRAELQADRRRLKQVLVNLLGNAIKYHHLGGQGGWVRVSVHPPVARQGPWCIEVADNGPGMTEMQRERLFTPFERLGAQHGPVAGTGLGLALSSELVQAMGGRIEVRTRLGEGSSFSVLLPG